MESENITHLIYVGEYHGKSAYYSLLRKSIMLGTVHVDILPRLKTREDVKRFRL